jgi:acyl carrier protein phosphodiesterase
MNRQWMYNADWRSLEFIRGVHEFLNVARQTCRMVSCAAPVLYVRMRGIILAQRQFMDTYSCLVSCQTIFVGLSTRKRCYNGRR